MIAAAVLKKPIRWDNEVVQLVFLIALGKDEPYAFMSNSFASVRDQSYFTIQELLKCQLGRNEKHLG